MPDTGIVVGLITLLSKSFITPSGIMSILTIYIHIHTCTQTLNIQNTCVSKHKLMCFLKAFSNTLRVVYVSSLPFAVHYSFFLLLSISHPVFLIPPNTAPVSAFLELLLHTLPQSHFILLIFVVNYILLSKDSEQGSKN